MFEESAVVNANAMNVYVEFFKSEEETRNRTLLINGALATSSSFSNWKKILKDKSDVITFDLPFTGKSKSFNKNNHNVVTVEDEVLILKKIISIYKPNVIASVSWGGASIFKLLNTAGVNCEHVIIASYSFEFNDVMRDYVRKANLFSKEKKFHDLALLMNKEVGEHLPKKMKQCNYKHLTSLDEIEYRQGCFHLNQISKMTNDNYEKIIKTSPCEFHFINGELDKHTPQNNIRDICSGRNGTSFYIVKGAGHFLDLEGKISRERMAKVFEIIFEKIRR